MSDAGGEARHDDDGGDLHDALRGDGEEIAIGQPRDAGVVGVVARQLQADAQVGGEQIAEPQHGHRDHQRERRRHPAVARPGERGEAHDLGQVPAGGAGDDRQRRQQEQRARREPQQHGLAGRDVDHAQDRPEQKAHEQIDAGPEQAGEDVEEIERPEVTAGDHGDHDGKRDGDVPEVMPADEVDGHGGALVAR